MSPDLDAALTVLIYAVVAIVTVPIWAPVLIWLCAVAMALMMIVIAAVVLFLEWTESKAQQMMRAIRRMT